MRWFLLLTSLFLASLTEAQTQSLESLRHQYAVSNAFYFQDKLPNDTKIKLTHHLKNGSNQPSMALTSCVLVVRLRCTIWINPDENLAKGPEFMTLYHEMCHIKLWGELQTDPHGDLFQACMVDLAERGAFRDWW